MGQEDIQRVINSFVATAKRIKQAGFNGIEIHSAHAYLLNQFFSSLTNQHSDKYGGTLNNRIRN